MMEPFDCVVRGGTGVTASDTMRCEVGVRAGRIAASAAGLPTGVCEVDATGLLVVLGGIDSHVHLAQPSGPETTQADDFRSGTLSARSRAKPLFYEINSNGAMLAHATALVT